MLQGDKVLFIPENYLGVFYIRIVNVKRDWWPGCSGELYLLNLLHVKLSTLFECKPFTAKFLIQFINTAF